MHNAGVASLPTASEWEHIVEITGDESWGEDNMRDVFARTETNLFVPEGTEGHGFEGTLTDQTSHTCAREDED